MKVLKFGGSSVADAHRFSIVAGIIKDYHLKGQKVAVVVSAMGGLTDMLIQMGETAAKGDLKYKSSLLAYISMHTSVVKHLLARKHQGEVIEKIKEGTEELGNVLHGVYLVRELTPRTLDYILSFGERNSAYILAEVLKEQVVPAVFVDTTEIVRTDDEFGAANVDFVTTNSQIQDLIGSSVYSVHVITGFIGATDEGVITTLGRGGSDYTAAIFGAALNVSEIEIWTDVNGVMTADPRKVKKAFPVKHMTYEEAMEMSHFGAKVIYPPTILPALDKKIPLRIRNTFNTDFTGTCISEHAEEHDFMVKGISSINQLALLTLQGSGLIGVAGTAARLFGILAHNHINIVLITQGSSEHSICLAVMPEMAEKARKVISEEFRLELATHMIDPIEINTEVSVIAVIGENMKSQPGISGRLFHALGINGINVVAIAQGSSERNVSIVIDRTDEAKALNAVHEAFFLSDTRVLNLFMVGAGLIGSTLLKQISDQAAYLKESQSLELRVAGLANTRHMAFHPNGILIEHWKEELEEQGEPSDLKAFVRRMSAMNLTNSIFIDNTAGDVVPEFYEEILDASISISTPNKVAASAPYETYRKLKTAAERRGIKFMFETNVGAGLPVITTLADLIASGDRILKIEGVLSGSLSFIFNSFGEGKRFSEIVRLAREKGYTEPDPRDDLSGKDVARKLLILAREAGIAMEAEDIQIEQILPDNVMQADSVEAFFNELQASDEHFEGLLRNANEAGGVLRFIASLEGEEAKISLQTLDATNPFFNLSGSDNMIVFTTERYKERPLVVKGPGAGADVTAAGVFAEIIRIGNFLG